MTHPDRQALLTWAAEAGLDSSIVDDPRMPAPPDRPLTLRQLAEELCDAEGIIDPVQRAKRRATVQRWPARREGFPVAEIPSERQGGRGKTSAIYSAQKVYAHLSKESAGQEPLDRLRSLSSPMTLVEISEVLGLHFTTVFKARDASLERLAQGADPEHEIPDPEEGDHRGYGTTYNPKKFAHFWQHRPGQGRHTRRSRFDRLRSLSSPMTLVEIAKILGVSPSTVYKARDASLERLAQGADPEHEIPDPEEGEHRGNGTTYNPKKFAHFWQHEGLEQDREEGLRRV